MKGVCLKDECMEREKIEPDPFVHTVIQHTGCWAAEYGNRLNLSLETIDSIIVSGAEYMNYGIFNTLAIKLFVPMTYKLMTKILSSGDVKFPAFLKIKMGITDDVFAPMLKQACQNLTQETTEATFWEALKLYPEHMSTWEPNPDIRISCWYGEKEMNMKKAIKHLKRAFPNLEVHPFKGLGHGEIMAHKELLVQELKAFLKK